mmetsp:Transcript_20288/g.45287  ORF Transcript_20288/g.45287 Transcript_20288/m.45287 type:complete len:244 (-) Transcript_20288:17-748(-)
MTSWQGSLTRCGCTEPFLSRLASIRNMQQQHSMYQDVEARDNEAAAMANADDAAVKNTLTEFGGEPTGAPMLIESGGRLDHLLLALEQRVDLHSTKDVASTPADWKRACRMPVLLVFKQIVHGLLYAPPEAKQLLGLDGDPHNFERLLMSEPAFLVQGLLPPKSGAADNADDVAASPAWQLRNYEFSMNPGILLKISQSIDQLSLGRTSSMTALRYTRKHDLFDKTQQDRIVSRAQSAQKQRG